MVPIGWLVAMIHLSRPRCVVPWSRLWLPVLAAVASVVLVLTNERHHLIWTRIDLMPAGVSPGAIFHHGPGYVIIAAWTYFMLLLSLVFLLTAEVPNAGADAAGPRPSWPAAWRFRCSPTWPTCSAGPARWAVT